MKELKVSDLNGLYNDADATAKELFAEMRSNVKLYLGLHYSKQSQNGLRGLANAAPISKEKKLRLTQNHIGDIMDKRINSIVSHSPQVFIKPRHSAEIADKKAADVGEAVWRDIQNKNDFKDTTDDLAFDFEVVGECYTYTYFDPNKGKIVGEEPTKVDEIGNVLESDMIYDGKVIIKKLEPFNVLVDPNARSFKDAEWVMFREMVSVSKLKRHFSNDEDIVSKINASAEESFTVFDTQTGNLQSSKKDQALLKYAFFRPCPDYPTGHFYIFLTDTILAHGELNDIFPIDGEMCTRVTSNPRGYSIIKRLRGPQAEINRISSQIAQTQIYFKDRLLISGGTKLSHGGTVAGTVGIRYNGAAPTVMNAKSGEQYLSVLNNQIGNLYKLGQVSEVDEEKTPSADPRTAMYSSMKQKKKFAKNVAKFESLLKRISKTALKTAQAFYDENHYIPAVDKKEWVSIEEFQNITDFDYSLEVKAMSQDIDTMIGEAHAIEHTMQYAQQLEKEQVAGLLANHPQLKDTNIVQEITADYRSVEDVFSQIERGRQVEIGEYDNHKYFIKKISNRMKESSFDYLNPQIQEMYKQRLQKHIAIEKQQNEAILRAQNGAVPSGGALITVSGVKDGEGNTIRLPYDTIMYAVKKLHEQGARADLVINEIENQGALASLAEATMLNQNNTHNSNMPQNQAAGVF